MRILCMGISHKTADVALRENVAFDSAAASRALTDLAKRWDQAEFAIVSTCNRTEIYTARAVHGHPRQEELFRWLTQFHGLDAQQYEDRFYGLGDAEAVRHLFSVAGGLDSLVIGEDQIVGQLKDAHAQARAAGASRSVLNRLFQQALHVAKHIRSETTIAAGKVSVASLAADCVARKFKTLAGKSILSIGVGEMNDLMLRQLLPLGPQTVLIANRTAAGARKFAQQCRDASPAGVAIKSVPFSTLATHLRAADVVLTSTGSDHPILTEKMIAAAQKARVSKPMLIVDIAVPRDVEAAATKIKGVTLYNIDDLEQIVSATVKTRLDSRPAAEKIIEDHAMEFLHQLDEHALAPTIKAMYRQMELIADEELAAARGKLDTHDDADDDQKILQEALRRTIRRIMHPLASNLRHHAGTKSVRDHLAAVRRIFGLED